MAFLKDLGPLLMEKYTPRAIVVLSAHWETEGGGVVTDYGDKNPLLFDYYGFPKGAFVFTRDGQRRRSSPPTPSPSRQRRTL